MFRYLSVSMAQFAILVHNGEYHQTPREEKDRVLFILRSDYRGEATACGHLQNCSSSDGRC